MEKVPQDDRPDRKVYSITDAGRTELMKWLAGPPPLGEARSAPLIQIFFAGQLSDDEILAKVESFAAMMRAILARYEQVPA
jgi:PadR family transcriptional regulator AphA